MAIYHLSVKAVSRSAGRSATAAAAYRAGCEIADERTGEIHDYRRKAGVESADIVLPDGAPEWATDRAKLWNAAELAEKRKDACVAREFEVALPAELSTAERRRLAFDFAKDMANREGCAVDVAIHAPGREGDNRNHHAHILRTTRKVEADGLGAKLDTEKAGRKRSDDLEAVRAKWADLMNERLRENGIAARVDHRSLEAQGIDRVPTKHLGPVATAYERRTGEPSRKRLDYRDEALERLAHAREAGELERQAKEADRSIIDLSGDLEEAKRERTAQQQRDQEQGQQAEHRRIERMTSTELSHEIGRVRPPKALDLVERDRSVMQAEQERQTLEKRHAEAGSALARARGQAQAWREAHGIRAALHDKGLMQSSTLAELEQQVQDSVADREITANILPGAALKKHYQIAFNLIPQIDVFKDNLYTKEEMKMIDETKKIMSDDSLRITATTIRVPVYRSHAESVNVEFEDEVSVEKAKQVLAAFPGVIVRDNPDEQEYPMPLYTSGKNDCEIGRIRKDLFNEKGMNFWIVGDQIRKGAALNALQIAEVLIAKDAF